jgi:hypothetical protein
VELDGFGGEGGEGDVGLPFLLGGDYADEVLGEQQFLVHLSEGEAEEVEGEDGGEGDQENAEDG